MHVLATITQQFHAMSPWLQALTSTAVGVGLGFLFERIILERLHSWAQKTAWRADDIIVDGLKGQVIFVFAVTGFYLAMRQLGYNTLLSYQLYFTAIVFLITISLTKITGGVIRLYTEQHKAMPTTSLFTNLTRIIVFTLGLLVVFQGLGIQITPLLGALGVGGLAVALAFEDTLKSMFAGLFIMATQKFKPGDFIKVEGFEGYVSDINWRVTTLKTAAKDIIMIPNSKLESSPVTNFSQHKTAHTITISVSVGYGSDLDQVELITAQAAKEIMNGVEEGASKFEPTVRFTSLGESGIELDVYLRVSERSKLFSARHEFIKMLYSRYKKEGIDIPYPTSTVHIQQ